MAFAVVSSHATSVGTSAASPGVSMTMPSGIAAGDLLLAFVAGDGSAAPTASGWTTITGNGVTAMYHRLLAKIAVGSDTMTLVKDANDYVCTILRVTNHGVTTLTTDILKANANGTTQYPDPPSVTISTTKDWLIVASFGADDDDLTATAWYPSGFTPIAQTRSATGTTSCMCSVASLDINTGTSYDPGQMQMAASEEWVAITIAIPPSIARILSGTSAIDTPLTTPGTIDIIHPCVISGTTGIGYVAGTTYTYYFDGHTSITDTSGVWSNDSLGFDNDTGPTSYTYTTTVDEVLSGIGTTAPSTGDSITSVDFEMTYAFTFQSNYVPVITVRSGGASVGEWFGSDVTTEQTTTDWNAASVPSGGWTWQKLQDLEARYVMSSASGG